MSVKLIDTRDKPVDNGFRGFVLVMTNEDGEIDREFFAPAERFRAESRLAEEMTKAGRSRQRELSLHDMDTPTRTQPVAIRDKTGPDWERLAAAPPPSKADLRREASIKRKADRAALARLSTPDRVYDRQLFTCQLTPYPEVTLDIVEDTPTITVYIPGLSGGRTRLKITMEGEPYTEVWELALDFLYKYANAHPGPRRPPPPESQWEMVAIELGVSDRATESLYPAMRTLRGY